MKIWRFENFIELVKCGSITAAAERLHISPQALHQQMDTLENEVGCRLLVRSRKGVTLTQAGTVFYSRIGRLVEDYRLLVADTLAQDARQQKTIRSMASALFTDHLFVHALVEFKKLYPDIAPTIAAAERVDSDSCDVIVNDLVYPADSYTLFSSVMSDCFIHVQHTHRLAGRKRISLDDLRGETLLVNTPHLLDQLDLPFWNSVKSHPGVTIEPLSFQGAQHADTMVLSTNRVYLCWGPMSSLHPNLRQIRLEGSTFEYMMLCSKEAYRKNENLRTYLAYLGRYYQEHWYKVYDALS